MTRVACSVPRMKDSITDGNLPVCTTNQDARNAHLDIPNGFDSENSLKTELITLGFLAVMVRVMPTGYEENCDGSPKHGKSKRKTTFLPESSVPWKIGMHQQWKVNLFQVCEEMKMYNTQLYWRNGKNITVWGLFLSSQSSRKFKYYCIK